MSELLSNAPLQKVACEFRFVAEGAWTGTVPGLVEPELINEYPVVRPVQQISLQFQLGDLSGNSQEANGKPGGIPHGFPVPQVENRTQFVTNDGSIQVSIGENVLVIENTVPYGGWSDYQKRILRAFSLYSAHAKPKAIRSISLAYINRIKVKADASGGYDISGYVRFLPSLPVEAVAGVETMLTIGFSQNVSLSAGPGHDILTLAASLLAQEEPNVAPVELVVGNRSNVEDAHPMPLDDCSAWLENAHDRLKTAFLGCVTERAIEMFNEPSEGAN